MAHLREQTKPSLYLIFDAYSNALKIGFGGIPEWRRRDLQIGNPNPLVLIGVMPGTRKDEKRLHRLFHLYAIRGEWFRFSRAICNAFGPDIYSIALESVIKEDAA